MWLMPSRKSEIVTIAVGREHIYCSKLLQTKNSFPLSVIAQKTYTLPDHAIGPLTIYNPTAITQAIRSFLTEHDAQHARVAIALSPPQIKSTITLQSLTQQKPYHGFEDLRQGWDWQYQYLYPEEEKEEEGFLYYACGMPYTLRFQWHLMAVQTPFNLVTLTSGSMALFALYEAINKSTFRRSKFAESMRKHNNIITRLFSHDTQGTMHRIVINNITKTPTPQAERLPLLINCGLFISELEGQ